MRALGTDERFSHGVEALKGLGILGIVFYHYYRRLSGVENQFQWMFGPLPSHPQEWGYLGASLFFILSGWGLAYAALGGKSRAEVCSVGAVRERPLQFFAKRLRRIVPLYYFSILFFFFYFLIFTSQDLPKLSAQFALKLLFLQNVSPETIFSYNSSWWFLGALVYLYAAYPWLLRAFQRSPNLALALCLVLSFAFSHLLALRPVAAWHPYLAMGGFPLVKLGEFGFGMWVAYVGRSWPKKWLGLTLLLTALGLLGLRHPAFYPLHPLGLVAPLLLVAGWIPTLGMARLGVCSYGLFLFHRPLIEPWLAGLRSFGLGDSAWLAPAIFTILVLAFTVPLEKWIQHVFGRK
ncbi:MAG: acyltransferase [Deltaproteobacteria bacterium]|nr:acyltransferase [Deltaproteobacteria bacterium]